MIADHPSNAPQLKVNPTIGETEKEGKSKYTSDSQREERTLACIKCFYALGSVHCVLCLFLKFSQLPVVVTSYSAQKS